MIIDTDPVKESTCASRSAFYVGGVYLGSPGEQVMGRQMYVERLTPPRRTQPVPLVLVHGGGQTSVSWLSTPDGRPGWADVFLDRGYEVYVLDHPGCGRSPWHPDADGRQTRLTAQQVEQTFTGSDPALSRYAHLRTRWPGTGRPGDPVFDAFYATQVPFVANFTTTEMSFREAGGQLLDQLGRAILVTHSQGGELGWALADARPGAVGAIVAVEPYGPPFHAADQLGGHADLAKSLEGNTSAWGITEMAMRCDPPTADAEVLHRAWEQRTHTDGGPGLSDADLPRLTSLIGVPVLIVTGAASHHVDYDHVTAEFLRMTGADVAELRLADLGILGNGHMMMLEENNQEIAALIADWLGERAAEPARDATTRPEGLPCD